METVVLESNYPINQYGFINENGTSDMIVDLNTISPDTPLPLHYHHMFEISLFTIGKGTYLINDKKYSIRTGDIFIIRNTEPHRIIMPPGETAENLVIHFDPGFLWNLYENVNEGSVLDVFLKKSPTSTTRLDRGNPHNKELADLFSAIRESFINPPLYHRLTVLNYLSTLLLTILNHYDYPRDSVPSDRITKKELFNIEAVIDHINHHLDSDLTLEELAKIACLNPSYFSSVFKKNTGASLFKYITAKRVELAQHMITNTNHSFSDIATKCGYNSSTSFNRAFKRIAGMSPSEYKKMMTDIHKRRHKA